MGPNPFDITPAVATARLRAAQNDGRAESWPLRQSAHNRCSALSEAPTWVRPAVSKGDPQSEQTPQRLASSIPYVVCTLVDIALSMNESHILSRITGRVGNVRATSEKPAVTNMDMVPVKSADPLTRGALRAAVSTG
jgi:hypothetical protein